MIIDGIPDVSFVQQGEDDHYEVNKIGRINSPCEFYKTITDSYYRFKSYMDDDTNTEYDESHRKVCNGNKQIFYFRIYKKY